MIVGDEGKSGELEVSLTPCDVKGVDIDEENEIFNDFVDDPNELIGKELFFKIKIGKGLLPEKLRNSP